MQFTPSQQEALNIEKHICVTAGAGSGKTTVLVERYLEILRKSNAGPENIVAITFTEKAAAEMKERVIERLNEAENISDRDSFLDQMSSAYISTIHAFCSRILREFPFQAKVPANFSVLQGIDQKLLLQKTLKETLKDIATNADDPHRPELRCLLQRYGAEKKLVEIFSTMIDKRDIVAKLKQEIYNDRSSTEIHADLEQRVLEKSMSAIDVSKFIRCLSRVSQVASGKNVESVEDLTQQLEAQYAKAPNSPEVSKLLKQFIPLITIKNGGIATTAFIGRKTDTTGIETEINFLVSTVKKIKTLPDLQKRVENNGTDDAETDACWRWRAVATTARQTTENDVTTARTLIEPQGKFKKTDDDFLLSTVGDLLTLYARVLKDYDTVKLSQGMLDFNDLQLKTRDLLRDNKKIRQVLVNRHQYYMVDEYQDTNELQYELVMLLTNELKSANLFIVGDPKQSIYGFRDADVRVFNTTKEKIVDDGGKGISLTENFRSLRDVIGFANYFFGQLMGKGNENEFEVEYEALTQARHAKTNGGIEILIGRDGDPSANEYKLIAQRIHNMIANQEETVRVRGEDRKMSERPIQYGDIAILIRARTHLPDIEHALLEAGIPYLTTGGIGFYQRQEIYDIWNYLNFLNDPSDNDASLAAILRSPAFGISDTELYEISLQKVEKQEKKSFWDKTLDYQGCTAQLRRAIDILKTHIEFAHRMPVNRLVGTIVNETGLIGTLKTGKYGQQRWANYQKLLELARNFDGDENERILPDFIEFLDILITEEPREGQAPIEASSGAVQIMTIHAAKGQQFPVVMLPRLDRQGQTDREPFIDEAFGIGFSPLNPDDNYQKTEPAIVNFIKNRANEKNVAEKKRLLYVGATRAEDRLILSGTLPDSGNPRQMLEWLHTHLGIGEAHDSLTLPIVEQKVYYKNGSTTSQSFPLEIPISRTLAGTTDMDAATDETIPIEFPEDLPSALQPTEVPAAFSVSELANYARCPLRYQLENVLRLPSIKQAEPDPNEGEMKNAILYVLTQIRKASDAQNLDTRIQQAFENFPETVDAETELRKHINSFLDSELGQTALSASETETNQHIYADIDGHILDGRIDRLFRDETGHWQAIIYETGDAQHPTVCSPALELYSLLIHRCYPEQPTVKINIFFTEQGQCEQGHFSAAELEEATEQWSEKILALQQGVYEKNLKHCSFCPYADTDDQCIVTDPQGESS